MRTILAVVLSAAAIAGCSQTSPHSAASSIAAGPVGDPAVWDLMPGQHLTESSSTFTALVTRTACHSGETGDVLAPDVRVTDKTIVVTFTVKAAGPGSYFCQGNDAVPYEVDLPGPIQGRALVDGQCATNKNIDVCADPTRFRP